MRKWKSLGVGPQQVDYELSDSDRNFYPQLLAPRRGTPIVLPSRGKGCKYGPGELWLALWIKAHGINGFYDNFVLSTGNHRYEPDLAYIDEEHGLFIDIEVDEPYTEGRSTPIHCIGNDDYRNNLITSAGWTVLRFSERQCIATPERVVRTIIDFVRSVIPEKDIPKSLNNVEPVDPDQRWDAAKAKGYASARYRDSYKERHLPLYRLYKKLFLRHRSYR